MRLENYEEIARLREEQFGILEILPIATHYFSESNSILYFHAQMLNDFHTIREITNKLLSCFD